MKRYYVILFSLVLLGACTVEMPEQVSPEAGENLVISLHAQMSEKTKTVLSDDGFRSSLSFELEDQLGFFADDVLANKTLKCTDGATGAFSGSFWVSGEEAMSRPSLDYYAYYPYNALSGNDPTALKGILPATQSAPFDASADYLVADPVTDVYDVKDFPALNFDFDTHLFAIVKLNVTNSNDAYADEEILSIGLESDGTPLAGQFTFSAIDGEVEFSNNPNHLSNKVLVEFATPPTLGKGITHSVYAVVNAAAYKSGSLKLVVNTTNNIFTAPNKKAVNLKNYKMTSLATANVNVMSRRKRVRTMMLWGDSITSLAYNNAVQAQLGPNWVVLRGGVPGDISEQVAARQGAIPMYTQDSEFIIPASSEESVEIDYLWWYYGGKYGKAVHNWTFRNTINHQLNPLIINGVECEIFDDPEHKHRYIRRITDGEPVTIPARSEVSTYGSRAYRDVDAIVVYMGTNGRPTEAKLIDLHDRIFQYLTNPDAFMIVLGFHQSTTDEPIYWKPAYVEAMTNHYGDYFIDQRTLAGGLNAIDMMYEIGQITSKDQISDTDWTYINRGDWPLSWFVAYGDTHPNSQYGAKVQAILIRRRMAELGLL